MKSLKTRIYGLLRSSEPYTKTDMVYLASSGFWGNLGTIAVTLFSFLLYLVFANYVSREAFGIYQYLLSISALLAALTFTGLNTAVTTAVAGGDSRALTHAVRFQLRWAWVPFIAAVLIAVYYALQGNAVLAAGLVTVGITMPLINAFNTYSAFLLGKEDFRRVFLYNFLINLPFYGLLIAAAFTTDSPLVLIAVSLGVQALGYFIAYRRTVAIYPASVEAQPSEFTRYGAHLSVMGTLSILALQVDSILAFHYLGAAGLAVYAFAVAIPERLGGLVKFIPMAALSRFSTRPFAEARRGIFRRLPIAILLLLAVAGGYALIAPFVFAIFFPQYLDAAPYSQWYALIVLSVITQLFVTLLSAHRFVRELYIYNVSAAVLQVGLQCIGILSYGLLGLIVGRLAGQFVSGMLAALLVLTATPQGSRH